MWGLSPSHQLMVAETPLCGLVHWILVGNKRSTDWEGLSPARIELHFSSFSVVAQLLQRDFSGLIVLFSRLP